MLHVCTFLWGNKYGVEYVEMLAAGVRRHLAQPYRFLCLTERSLDATFSPGIERHAIKDPELLYVKGCFARLRLFDPGWQTNRGIKPGDRVLCVDLDLVVTGGLDPVVDREEGLVVIQGANAANPCPYTCTLFMLRAGVNAHVWHNFSLEASGKVPYYEFPDDQGWLADQVPNAGAWGPKDGVYCFQKRGWPKGDSLPENARVVAFPGWRDPSKFVSLDWVKDNWRT